MGVPLHNPRPHLSASALYATALSDPLMYASTQDRDEYIEVVKRAYADGQLDNGGLDERISRAIKSKTLVELATVLDGLNLARLTVGAEVAVTEPEKTVSTPDQRLTLSSAKWFLLSGTVVGACFVVSFILGAAFLGTMGFGVSVVPSLMVLVLAGVGIGLWLPRFAKWLSR